MSEVEQEIFYNDSQYAYHHASSIFYSCVFEQPIKIYIKNSVPISIMSFFPERYHEDGTIIMDNNNIIMKFANGAMLMFSSEEYGEIKLI